MVVSLRRFALVLLVALIASSSEEAHAWWVHSVNAPVNVGGGDGAIHGGAYTSASPTSCASAPECFGGHLKIEVKIDEVWYTEDSDPAPVLVYAAGANWRVYGVCLRDPAGASRYYRSVFDQAYRAAPLILHETIEAVNYLSCDLSGTRLSASPA